MRIIAFPFCLFDLVAHKPEWLTWALSKFLEVVDGAIVLDMSPYTKEYFKARLPTLYHWATSEFKARAALIVEFETKDGHTYPFLVDEMLMKMETGDAVTFCGGYMESGLGQAHGIFLRDYKSFCEEKQIQILLDEDLAICARSIVCKEDIFLGERYPHKRMHPKDEFDWWSRVFSSSRNESALPLM